MATGTSPQPQQAALDADNGWQTVIDHLDDKLATYHFEATLDGTVETSEVYRLAPAHWTREPAGTPRPR